MKILHVVSTYPPYRGGMGNVAFEEVTRLAKLRHDVHVATLAYKEKSSTKVEGKVTVHRLKPTIGYGKAGFPLKLRKLVLSEEYDVVHLHMPFFGVHELFFLMMKLGWKGDLVLTYHMDVMASGFVHRVAKWSRTKVVPAILDRTQKVFVSSMDYARESWLKDSWKDVEKKLVSAPFGVDTKRFKPRKDRKKSAVTRFLFVGGLDSNHYFKGLEVLLEALSNISNRTDWTLTVAGSGDLKESYEEQARAAKISQRVEFVGRVTDAALPLSYGFSDVFVFPSVDRSEAFGLVALEAQSCGVPVIASDLSGVRTVVSDKASGILVTPKDVGELQEALVWMIDHPKAREDMGKTARARVEKMFTWDRHVAMLEKVYEDIGNK
ncbi:glycosyltransferase [Candidatus Uhrbacteria bacterium]|jgi:glycosyltransferase involved in cell wall biosynthesis|nr:glycosyltransferase [Candidatus Uhrbacteria bacterium]